MKRGNTFCLIYKIHIVPIVNLCRFQICSENIWPEFYLLKHGRWPPERRLIMHAYEFFLTGRRRHQSLAVRLWVSLLCAHLIFIFHEIKSLSASLLYLRIAKNHKNLCRESWETDISQKCCIWPRILKKLVTMRWYVVMMQLLSSCCHRSNL